MEQHPSCPDNHVRPMTEQIRTLTADASSFHFLADTKAWLQAMQAAKSGWVQTNPAYEEFYQKEIPVGTQQLADQLRQ